ncbi:hypothetical protein J4377_07085 [Halomonas sp. XH26]|uniref:DUF6624 domain-containing protein n=1 Tax=Halomonas sp. XH26 TaxID=2557993 RepID=UPI00209D87DA|nr:DUF6624 domain-containing protein [Halomonas sp. XH26]UTA81225.1 hypothetical protein J4377_07085 [Halomonas sp. XH26]
MATGGMVRGFVIAIISILPLVACASSGGLTESIRDELIEMAAGDQEFRSRLAPMLSTVDFSVPPTGEFLALVSEQNEIDTRNTLRLREIVDAHRWPQKSEVGEEASKAAQLLVQHSALEHQKYLLPSIKEAVLQGEADASSMAMLEDDILVAEGNDQIFGTEITNSPDGGLMLYPVHDSENINARRLAVGLPTIEEYIGHAEFELGRKIDVSTLNQE